MKFYPMTLDTGRKLIKVMPIAAAIATYFAARFCWGNGYDCSQRDMIRAICAYDRGMADEIVDNINFSTQKFMW